MNRAQLEHILRACSAITMQEDFIVIGSQAILGSHQEAPPDLLVSMEADVYPRADLDASRLIDGAIGEGSLFHETFGYYAHGVGPETAVLPDGWEQRLVAIKNDNTNDATGWCLDPADLTVSKLAAGRPHDLAFVKSLLSHGLIEADVVISRVAETSALTSEARRRVASIIDEIRPSEPRDPA